MLREGKGKRVAHQVGKVSIGNRSAKPMKILVLGATGMLGHKLMQVLGRQFEVSGTVRREAAYYVGHPMLGSMNLIGGIRAEDIDSIIHAIAHCQPAVVINCIGIIKQLPVGKDPLPSITINALFPHRLAQLCGAAGVRLVHFSTDCVFSGKKGNYTEDDVADAEDLYGRSKFLGEVSRPGSLTLRTSIIGRELGTKLGLVEWFISMQGGTVAGYTKAIYSGFTTQALADLVANILIQQPDISGLWQVSSSPISKFDLLNLINDAMGLKITINRDEVFFCDRSLNSTRFRRVTGYDPPGWSEMVVALAKEATLYDSLKR
jgi:dTDP-4-dehydrorhamnose reductase